MRQGNLDPFAPQNYKEIKILSSRNILLYELNSAETETTRTLSDLREDEFTWEPLVENERLTDISLPPERKRVWRVFKTSGRWTYDYAVGELSPTPFTTIHWIMNHVAQTGDMYLHCIKTEKPESEELAWDDLPVYTTLNEMRNYIYEMLEKNRQYLKSIETRESIDFLNKLTPAPWGELRPTWLNIWGGVIQHTIQHMMQVAVRKESIRLGLIKTQ